MSDKLDDFIAECMSDTGVQVPFPDFEAAFCDRCLNSLCQRSAMQGLKWTRRMKRQEEALFNPTFADPLDPAYQHLHEQDFVTLERNRIQVAGWESFDAPERFQEREQPVIHKAEPKSENQATSKVKDSVSVLAALNGKEVPREDPELPDTSRSDPPEEGQEPVDEHGVTPQESPQVENPQPRVAPEERPAYNTVLSQEDLMLKPAAEILKPSRKALGKDPEADPWAAPSENKKLVVRASDGKVLDTDD